MDQPSPEATASAENFLTQTLAGLGVTPVTPSTPKPPETVVIPKAAVPPGQQFAPPAPAPAPAADLAGMAAAAMQAAAGTSLETPPAEAPAEETVDEPIPTEAAGTEKSRSAWTGVKRENKELKAKIAQYEAKLKTGDPELTEKLKAQEEAIAEYEDKIGRLDLTQSKTFQDKYERPVAILRQRSINVLMRHTGRTAEDAQAFLRDLESADPATARQAMSEEPPGVQGALLQNLIEAQEAAAIRDRAVSDWRNSKSSIEIDKGKDEEAEALRQVVSSTTDAVKVLAATPEEGGEGDWLFRDQVDNPQWMEQKNRIVSAARAALRDNKVVPQLVLQGVASQIYRKMVEQLYQQNAELKKAVESRDRLRGRIDGRPVPKGTPVRPVANDPESFVNDLIRENS